MKLTALTIRRSIWAGLGVIAMLLLAAPVFAQTDPGPTDPVAGLSIGLALTAAGAGVVAAFITGIVEVLSRTIKALDGHEQTAALILSAIVVVAAVADAVSKGTMIIDIGTIFAGVVAWYGIARISMGIHDDVLERSPDTSLGTAV